MIIASKLIRNKIAWSNEFYMKYKYQMKYCGINWKWSYGEDYSMYS